MTSYLCFPDFEKLQEVVIVDAVVLLWVQLLHDHLELVVVEAHRELVHDLPQLLPRHLSIAILRKKYRDYY